MKAEERHEQRENDLAGWLQYGLVHWIREYGSYVLLGLALAFLGFQLWNMHQRTIDEAHRKALDKLRTALVLQGEPKFRVQVVNGANPDDLSDLIDTTEFKEVKSQAALALGSYYHDLIAFPEDLDAKKLTREEALTRATDRTRQALEIQGDDQLIAGRAHLGLAAIYEDKGEWDKARAEYEILTAKTGLFAGSPFADLAEERLKTLGDRQNAPRLASMIPPPAPVTPATPTLPGLPGGGLLGPMGGTNFQDLLGTPASAPTPSARPPLPATPAPAGPFQAPSIPGIGLTPEPVGPPASAPAK